MHMIFQTPIQPLDLECGYFVLMFMKEIVEAQSYLDVINSVVSIYCSTVRGIWDVI